MHCKQEMLSDVLGVDCSFATTVEWVVEKNYRMWAQWALNWGSMQQRTVSPCHLGHPRSPWCVMSVFLGRTRNLGSRPRQKTFACMNIFGDRLFFLQHATWSAQPEPYLNSYYEWTKCADLPGHRHHLFEQPHGQQKKRSAHIPHFHAPADHPPNSSSIHIIVHAQHIRKSHKYSLYDRAYSILIFPRIHIAVTSTPHIIP